ncbi:MAG: hypothetical protein JWP52_1887 [Rhizobacter sp.]|nr:hypothetical protein [Rhizobacter sp.]
MGFSTQSPSLADYGRDIQQPKTASWNGPTGQTPKTPIRTERTSKGDGLNHYQPTTHIPRPPPHLSRNQQTSFVKSVASLHAKEFSSPRIPVLKTGADVRNAVLNDFGRISNAGNFSRSAPIVIAGTDGGIRASARLQIEILKVAREQGIRLFVLPYTQLQARNLVLMAAAEERFRPPNISPQDLLTIMEQASPTLDGVAELAVIQAARALGYQVVGIPPESGQGNMFSRSYLDRVVHHAHQNGGAVVTTWPPTAIDMASQLDNRGMNVYSMSFAEKRSEMAGYQTGAMRKRPIDRSRNHVYHLDPSLADRWGFRS